MKKRIREKRRMRCGNETTRVSEIPKRKVSRRLFLDWRRDTRNMFKCGIKGF